MNSQLEIQEWFFLKILEDAVSYGYRINALRDGGRVVEDNGFVHVFVRRVVSSTERALRVVLEAEDDRTGTPAEWTVWIPKSVTEGLGSVFNPEGRSFRR